MSDLSFFVGLQIDAIEESKVVTDMNANRFLLQRQQGPGCMGKFLFHLDRQCLHMSYEIKAIDCDQKPAIKLRSRQQKEDSTFSKVGPNLGMGS
jgi:hypothetical protein